MEHINLSISDYDYPENTISEEKYSFFERNIEIVEKKANQEKKSRPQFRSKSLQISYGEVLNKEQLSAVVQTEGPMLVIAGAGSGKTRIIVYKVCFLIENRVLPEEIVLLTFTRRAAAEMLQRAGRLSQSQNINKISGGTFHSFASKMLRRYHKSAGIDPSFSIIDTADSADIISWIKKDLAQVKKYSVKSLFPNKNRLQEIISASKNKSVGIRYIIEESHPKLAEFIPEIEIIAEKYQSYKKRANIFDYDDILETFKERLQSKDEFREIIQRRFKYFLVDEYQDTNKIQRQILKLLTGDRQNLTVVGDDAQSIYAFRGANFENILSFLNDFHNGKVIKVEQNYRSSRPILDFTNSVINNALLGYKKHLYTEKTGGGRPLVGKFYDEETEARFIAEKIEELYGQEKKLKEMAVLYRSSWQSNFLQRELLRRRIPFITVGGIKFIERKHVKDTLAYLKVSQNKKDAPSWTRLLGMIEGVGEKTVLMIIETIFNGQEIQKSFSEKKYAENLMKLLTLIEKIRTEKNIGAKMDLLYSHYFPYLDLTEEDSEIRKNDLESLKKMAGSYSQLDEFLNDFSLDPPNQAFQDREVQISENEDDCLTLSTIHSAKGLEWQTVFILHCLDGLLPSYRSLNDIAELEEERRLFYVACTRAKNNLFITMPFFSMSFDKYFSYPTRFLAEANPDTFEFDFQ